MSQSINFLEYFKSAYYHTENYISNTECTQKILELYNYYKNNINTSFIVSNQHFIDNAFNNVKTLFLNFEINNSKFSLQATEGEVVFWNIIIEKIENIKQQTDNSLTNSTSFNLLNFLSIGEIIDKYSILELKTKYISDENKLRDIKYEMNVLENYVSNAKSSYFYKLLLYINKQIWLDTDIIKSIDLKGTENTVNLENTKLFSTTSNKIFENNQKRFRLKNYFNILESSTIKEHKSYSNNICYININNEQDIYNKIPEINYICISYDLIYFNKKYENIITKIFKNPNILFTEIQDNLNFSKIYNINTYDISTELKNIFDFEPLKYKSAGKLGDFFNQLSVICEKYYETGRKGILYVYNLPTPSDHFLFGLENMYNDTYNSIISVPYIADYKIYNNDSVDIDLSGWRSYIATANQQKQNWYKLYKNFYKIEWGKHQWLYGKIINDWSDKILINHTPYRDLSENAIIQLSIMIKNDLHNCVFISNEESHYNYFVQKSGLNIPHYKPQNFEETVNIINSSKLGFYGFSSMAVVANALHKNHYIIGKYSGDDCNLNTLTGDIPHVLGMLL